MKLAVLGDIHSNHAALRACLGQALALGAERFLFLGDYVSDCADPQKTMGLLYALARRRECLFIKGNREEYLLDYLDGKSRGWRSPSSSSGGLLYTYRHLSPRDFSFFRGLPIRARLEVEGCPAVECCHGSPSNTRGELAFGGPSGRNALEALDASVLICAHTHKQGVYLHAGKKLVNPGSVGIPSGHGGKAQFAMLYGRQDCWQEEFHQLDYPRKETIEALHTSGLYAEACVWARLTEAALLTGEDRTSECLALARQLCARSGAAALQGQTPERWWREAAARLNL